MIIERLTILSGHDKSGQAEEVPRIDLTPGRSLALVGPTGSGKSELLSDIEQLADCDTRSGRRVLINNDARQEPVTGLVATLSQKTNFVMDADVREFILMHAESRDRDGSALCEPLLAMANTLCGEPILPDMPLQVLSGGQSRALMIADIALLSDAPVVLIDEIENAGIDKFKAMQVLAGSRKIVISATHDPVLMLMNDARLIMRNGGMHLRISSSPQEQKCTEYLRRLDQSLMNARDILRAGQTLDTPEQLQ
jgi:ABC-type lipoprotein export system ATPase subunit